HPDKKAATGYPDRYLKIEQYFDGFAETVAQYDPDDIAYPDADDKAETPAPPVIDALLDRCEYHGAHRKYQQQANRQPFEYHGKHGLNVRRILIINHLTVETKSHYPFPVLLKTAS
ncbi:MAG TPA: hypothetical protein PLQ40_09075, partial [Ferruginibacter sp.]|nr:hypothetical protein [Ferruginibacter sp.]